MGIEGIICPAYVSCAFKSVNASDMTALFDYQIIWNAFNLPLGCVPITLVEAGEEEYTDGINDQITKIIRNDIQGSVGLPVGV